MKFLTTNEAADKLGVTRLTIYRRIDKGELTATKFGRDWMVVEDDRFKAYEKGKITSGRPRKKGPRCENCGRPLHKVKREGKHYYQCKRCRDLVPVEM